ncbi:MAG: DEAD/DEAH box helicase [Bacteroidota bacterium]
MILFNETGLAPDMLKATEQLGFVNPTPIQEKTIPLILNDKSDIVALAQTGTGKTAAFGLPVIQQIEVNNLSTQALVLCPTRELCLQITGDLTNFSKFRGNLNIVPVYGGASINDQIRLLDKGAHIVVATPGRAVDLINRRKLKLNTVNWLVLDEADEMLSMGFKDDLDKILSGTPQEKQTLLFSATMPKEIASIAKKYMNAPVEISVGRTNQGAENVEHEYFVVHARDRYEALKRIADVNPRVYGIVFCRTRAETKEVADNLIRDGYNADALHGDLSQEMRDIVMNRFRNRRLQILVATDVAARGLDVNDLTHVINYNLPDDPEVYIHRSGRTGRAGKKGTSISILHLKERGKLREIEKMLNRKMELKQVPTGKDICEKQLFNLIDRVEKADVSTTAIDNYLQVIYKKLEWLDREELIKHFVAVEFNRFLEAYENAPDLNVDQAKSYDRNGESGSRGKKQSKGESWDYENGFGGKNNFARRKGVKFSRMFMNIGKSDRMDKRTIINMINDTMPGKSVEIGEIEVLRNFSFFEIDRRFEFDLQKAFRQVEFKGKRIGLEVAKPK